jgi:hypothetical protein
MKKWDLAVKVGTYMKDGQEKNRYQNIGVVMDKGNGPFLLLNRYFNPAGVPCDPDKDSILVSMFKPRVAAGGSFDSGPTEDVPF